MAEVQTSSNASKIEKAVDSVWAKVLARLVAPFMLTLVGYLGLEVRNDIRNALVKLSDLTTDVRVLQHRVSTVEEKIKELDRRPK